jgi:hypothetical protein
VPRRRTDDPGHSLKLTRLSGCRGPGVEKESCFLVLFHVVVLVVSKRL